MNHVIKQFVIKIIIRKIITITLLKEKDQLDKSNDPCGPLSKRITNIYNINKDRIHLCKNMEVHIYSNSKLCYLFKI